MNEMELVQGGLSKDANCGITAALTFAGVAVSILSGGSLFGVAVGWAAANFATLKACNLI